jgi:hypothetical protein
MQENSRNFPAEALSQCLNPMTRMVCSRRYSAHDLERLRRIGQLLQAGLNLAGMRVVLDLQDENTQLRAMQQGPSPDAAGQCIGSGPPRPEL